MSEHLDDLVAAGLYDPADAAAAERLELFEFLLDEIGASIPELVQADEQGGLLSFAAFRSLRVGHDGMTFAEAAARAEIDPDTALQLWRGAGFADPRPFERRFGSDDVEMFRLFGLLATFVPEEQVLQLMRTIGEAVGRVAEAEVALVRSNIEAPLAEQRQFLDVAVRMWPSSTTCCRGLRGPSTRCIAIICRRSAVATATSARPRRR